MLRSGIKINPKQNSYLGANSCHVIVCHIFLIKYMGACFLRQLLVIANIILKQLIIPEYHMGVYHKEGSNTNGRTSIFDVSNDYVKRLCQKGIFLANVIFLILIWTRIVQD